MPRITQPRADEPIRLVENKTGHVYRVTIDTAQKGAPRRQITRTFPSLKTAREFVQTTRESQARGSYIAPQAITLGQLCTDWLASKRDVREITRNGYANALRPAVAHLGGRPAQSLTRKDIDNLVAWAHTSGGRKGQALSQRSVVYMLGTVKQVLAYGVASGLLATNVAQGVKPPRRTAADKRRTVVWTPEQLRTYAATAKTDSWAAGLRLLLCGMRRSEVCGLRWSDVDLDLGTVMVSQSRVLVAKQTTSTDDPKSSASRRTVPVESMFPGSVAILKATRKRQATDRLKAGEAWTETGLVVVDALGNGIHPDALAARWRKVCETAGVPEIGPHAARHTLATMLHGAGAAPADVAALLGHEVNTHLIYYVKPSEAGPARAASTLGTLLAGG
ncbi:MAG TPA: site-specific integrase [Microlunatus sp.]